MGEFHELSQPSFIERIITRPFKDAIQRKIEDIKSEETAKTYLADLGLTWKDLKDKKILDIGAGGGRFAKAAKKRGIEVISVDLLPTWLKGINPEKGIDYVQANALNLPFSDESFDVVVARAAVHSMVEIEDDLRQVFSETKRVLKQKGEFRFGPGGIRLAPFREDEWAEWERLVAKVENKEEITPTEDARGQILFDRLERNELEEQLSSLDMLKRYDPNITQHAGNMKRYEKGLDSHTYFVLKKE